MTRPTRRKESSTYQYRSRVPKDVVAKARGQRLSVTFLQDGADKAATVVLHIADTVKLSLRTRDPAVAKARIRATEEQLSRAWEAIRQGPRKLTHKEVVALAGKAYRAFAEACEDDPGGPALWRKVQEDNASAARGEWAKYDLRIPTSDSPQERLLTSLKMRFGDITDAIVRGEGLVITPESRDALVVEVAKALQDSAKKLERNALGDFTPDQQAARFPAWEGQSAKPSRGKVTLSALFDGWKAEALKRKLARKTLTDYESRWGMFAKWLGHSDAAKVTPEDVIRYKDHRLEVVSVKTVNASDLTALKAIFGWGVENRRLPSNPAEGIRVRAERKRRERERYFRPEEAKAILRLAKAHAPDGTKESAKTSAVKRWIPWLCAYSGARVGEVLQLRTQDIVEDEGVWFIRITPDAGTVKTGEFRPVPIHQDLIDQGFLRFVRGARDGYLFVNASNADEAQKRVKSLQNRLQAWVRTVLTDTRVAPNRGWRHTFKARAQEAALSDTVADAICGHAPRSVGDYYRPATPATLAEFIGKFPRYEV